MERHWMDDVGEPNPRQASVDRTRDATVASMNSPRSAAEKSGSPSFGRAKKGDALVEDRACK